LSLQVPAGSICGFLGRNGAGKTTTIKVLLGMARPPAERGRLRPSCRRAEGERRHPAPHGVRQRREDLYDSMNVEEMIRFTAPFFPRWRGDLEQRISQVRAAPDRKVKALSRGMRTKLALLLALCRGRGAAHPRRADLGLDPAMTEEALQALVTHVAGEEMTVFFSSHQIAEVDQIADHVAIIDRGRVVLAARARRPSRELRRIQLVFDGDARMRRSRDGASRACGARVACSRCWPAQGPRRSSTRRERSTGVRRRVPVTLKEIFLETVSAEGLSDR